MKAMGRVGGGLRALARRGAMVSITGALLAAGVRPAAAQLSPGPLAAAHAGLEGVENCSRCHSIHRAVDGTRCLACHAPLRARVEAGRGLHAGPAYRTCGDCHVEHQGRGYALIYWKNGETSFDHSLSGYVLRGRHAALTCRECHRPEFVKDPAVRKAPGIDPARTFLGLDRDCVSCHRDPHAGDLGTDCARCHGEEQWKPAPGFDHARTRYPLDGLHRAVDCMKCHAPAAAPGTALSRFRVIAFASCADCHQDPHHGRLQAGCASCHTTSGWSRANTARFDHDLTRYPLRGRHVSVACSKCHEPGRPMTPLRFDACADCHAPYHHAAEHLARADAGACENCHSVAGFSPSSFTLARHATTPYPLDGAHRAVACPACHRPAMAAPRPRGAAVPPAPATGTHAAGDRCETCHLNPHGDDVHVSAAPSGCESCHLTATWSTMRYDHAITGFTLDGGHGRIGCAACHTVTAAANGTRLPRFDAASTWCADCHEDIHAGQFAAVIHVNHVSRRTTDCARCHVTTDWLAERFDHSRDSRYPLDGAHARVRCEGCHRSAEVAGRSVVRYRPLDTRCESCHGHAAGGGTGSP